MEKFIEIKNLSISFETYERFIHKREIKIIEEMNLTVHKGEILSIVGESGSGKSLLAQAIFGVLPANAIVTGDILYQGQVLTDKKRQDLYGKNWAIVPQSVDALDPTMTISKQLEISVVDDAQKVNLVKAGLEAFALPDRVLDAYPHELSGGMLRRVLALTAFLSNANFIVADEPTPGMDQKALDHFTELLLNFKKTGTAIIITHDIQTALTFSDRLAIFREGQIIEVADTSQFSGNGELLSHPYTKLLWRSLADNNDHILEVNLNESIGC